ncbi:DNA repair protein rhp54 [Elysia marginata]|uniref:DNA repair protein rhp54 n=1 Tax=Elysia marginata TaxID=1093978 RepID=A0AAV4JD12_9GAST|nr:DNA repair protein rhp54 [Elysia marginata]
MGPTCTSTYCQKSKSRHCSTFEEERRKAIFTEFWNMRSWDERYTDVKTIFKKVKKKQARSESEERDSSYEWNLSCTEGENKQVCRKMFASTLGVSERTLCSWLTKEKQNVVPTVEREVTNPQTIKKPLSEEDKTFLEEWLLAIPTVPSQYCRKQLSYEGKRFIHEGRSQHQLHSDYTQSCHKKGFKAVEWKYFNGAFHRLNMSVFIPKKDQCDVCVGYKHGNIARDV